MFANLWVQAGTFGWC